MEAMLVINRKLLVISIALEENGHAKPEMKVNIHLARGESGWYDQNNLEWVYIT